LFKGDATLEGRQPIRRAHQGSDGMMTGNCLADDLQPEASRSSKDKEFQFEIRTPEMYSGADCLRRRTQGEKNLPAVSPAVSPACGDYQ
jgi:hypothetical protein